MCASALGLVVGVWPSTATLGAPNGTVGLTSECCNVHPTPGCSDADCEKLVCDIEPLCCQLEWDLACTMAAADLCGLKSSSDCCGFIGAGKVCSDEACVEIVCAEDPFCCDTSWDTLCGFEAQELCGALCACASVQCNKACPADLNFDGDVGRADLGILIAAWGTDSPCADLNGDGVVDGADLGLLLAAFGPCPATPPIAECCNVHPTPGCSDADCEAQVCKVEPLCCVLEWDLACAKAAMDLCGLAASSDCCGFIGAGKVCSDEACVEIVCAADPFCCDTSWDTLCGFEAQELCGDLCACTKAPSFTAECCNVHPTPGCSDADCEAQVCKVEPLCCVLEWDLACAKAATDLCGLASSSDCCGFIGAGKVCSDEACVEIVCAADPFCCDTSWDTLCGFEAQELCGDLCACTKAPSFTAECCNVHPTPGCSDADCEAQVCKVEPLCCVLEWDLACAKAATDLCGLASSSDCCGFIGAGKVCSDEACVEIVCAADPFCCDTSWDTLCGFEAQELCGDLCACTSVSFDEECCNVHLTPGCSDAACEKLVCNVEPLCCQLEWDLACTMAAADLCGLTASSDCCGFIGPGKVCSDEACVEIVCAADPFCCDTSWDTLCGIEAQQLCGSLCQCSD